VFGVACLLLIALWVRSYRSADVVHKKLLVPYEMISVRGRLKLTRVNAPPAPSEQQVRTYPVNEDAAHTIESHILRYSNDRGFGLYDRRSIILPHWFVGLITCVLAGLSWLPGRFSLRTLLIATTLVAAVLGLIVWLVRA
jgi:hypothetical protein